MTAPHGAPEISVVVCTYNGAERLPETLRHTPAFLRCLATWTRGMIEEIRRLRREGAEGSRHVLTGRAVE